MKTKNTAAQEFQKWLAVLIPGCHKCIDSCPAQAIKDGSATQKLCRLNTYGKTARGFDTVDCNKCRTVCPMRFGKA